MRCSCVPLLLLVLRTLRPVEAQIAFTAPPSDTVAVEGGQALFDCAFTSFNPVSIIWRHNGSVATPSDKFTYLANNSLLIDPIQSGDQGEYTCVVTDLVSNAVEERSASLTFALFIDSFSIGPDDHTVDPGVSLLLFCTHRGSQPPATITWTHNNNVVTISSHLMVESHLLLHTNPTQVSSRLTIVSVEAGDAGSYRCQATNELLPGTLALSDEGILNIRALPAPPSFSQHPQNTAAITGQTVTLVCSVIGVPSPSVAWSRDGTAISSSGRVSIQTGGGTSLLTVSSVMAEDEGVYRCMASNTEGTAESDAALLQLAFINSVFQLQPSDTVAVLNKNTRIDCLAPESIPTATVSWTRDFSQLTGSRFQVLSNGSLLVEGVQVIDEGIYRCIATNGLLGQSRTSNAANLTVLVTPSIEPSNAAVVLSQSVTFVCAVEGTSDPLQLQWLRGTAQIVEDTRVQLTSNSLFISSVERDDEGNYTCRAIFTGGVTETVAFLDVLAPPFFLNTSIRIAVFEGASTTLPCLVAPDDTLSFSWSFQGSPVATSEPDSRAALDSNGGLILENVLESDEGAYTCTAINSLGGAEGIVEFKVYFATTVTANPPNVTVSEGATATLNCLVTGIPSPSVTWYQGGVEVPNAGTPRYQLSSGGTSLSITTVEGGDEGEFVCRATNPGGFREDTVDLVVYTTPRVTTSPLMQQLLEGSTALFDCVATGNPLPEVHWLNSASMDVLQLGDPRIQVLSNGSLVIVGVSLPDGQQFVCEASNVVGQDIAVVSLTVLAPPTVTLPPSTIVTQGESLTLDCQPTGSPAPSVLWTRDGAEVEASESVTLASDGTLVISPVFTLDAGSYSCVASNTLGTASAVTTLTVLVAPVVQLPSPSVAVVVGSQAMLDCVATGIPNPIVTWFFDSIQLPNSNLPRIEQAPNGSLAIAAVEPGDAGGYQCVATNQAGSESGTVQLVVYVPPTITALDAIITAIQGATATLTCLSEGDPPPVLSWFRAGSPVPSATTPRYRLTSEGSVLVIDMVSEEEDEAVFSCVGVNTAGVDQDSVTLSVLVPPSFAPLPANSTAVEGTQHTLTCSAEGDPTPILSWSHEGIPLSLSGTLLFPQLGREDTGVYTCTASNSAGVIAITIYLDVYYPPSITQPPTSITAHLNSDATFMCISDGNPAPLITWLFNGEAIMGAEETSLVITATTSLDAGQYVCSAANLFGQVSAAAQLTVLFPPSSPINVIVMATGSTSLQVQWDASASDGGSPLTSYLVEYRVAGGSDPLTALRVPSDTQSTSISSLSPFTSYEVRVAAENAVGPSQPSSIVTVRTDPAPPAAPGSLTVVTSSSSTLTIAWSTPDPLNGQLAAYELQYGPEATFADDLRATLIFNINQYTIFGVQPSVLYRVRLRASTVSLFGESLWGPYAELRVLDGIELPLPSFTPAPSSSLSLSLSSSSAIVMTTSSSLLSSSAIAMTTSSMIGPPQLTTNPPLTSTPSPLTSTPSPVSSQLSNPTTAAVTSSPPPPTPTSTAAQATPSVPAVSPSPTPVDLMPPTVVPEVVLLFTPPGTVSSILVYWRKPTSGLDTFDGYQIHLSPPPPPPLSSPFLAPNTDDLSSSLLLENLANYTLYTISVATYNEDGVGPLTVSESIRTPETEPGAPSDVTVDTVSQTTIIVSWQPPVQPNGILLDYELTVREATSGSEVTRLSIPVAAEEQGVARFQTVTGLSLEEESYSVTVSGRTSVGQGPKSVPIFVGIDVSGSSSVAISSIQVTPLRSLSPLPTTDTPPTSPQTLSISAEATPSPLPPGSGRDAEYYIVRIVPPIVLALILITVVVMTAVFCITAARLPNKQRKGQYAFSEIEDEELELQKTTKTDEVAQDDIQTSAYYVKDQLNANFSFVSPHREGEEGKEGMEGSLDINEPPDIGEPLGEGVHRDALEEYPSRPESTETTVSTETALPVPDAFTQATTRPSPRHSPRPSRPVASGGRQRVRFKQADALTELAQAATGKRAGSPDSGLEASGSLPQGRHQARRRPRVGGAAFEESFSPLGGWGVAADSSEGAGFESVGFEGGDLEGGGVGFENVGFEGGEQEGGGAELDGFGLFPGELQETRIGAVGMANGRSATETSAHMY